MSNPYKDNTSKASSNRLDLKLPNNNMPKSNKLGIALVGCGAIGKVQIQAYKDANWNVVAICDSSLKNAEQVRDKFYPNAHATNDYADIIEDKTVNVVDLAMHVDKRPALVEKAIKANKHVLSQKPFVEDLQQGSNLVKLARQHKVRLAVNHNGRWAAHFRALKYLIEENIVGNIFALDFACYWPHDELLKDHKLGNFQDLVLYDFAIHWFDLVAWIFEGKTAKSVTAHTLKRFGQEISAPTLAAVIIQFDDLQVSINMRASARMEDYGSFHACGERGSISYSGASLGGKTVEVQSDNGSASVDVSRPWFPFALRDCMGDFLYHIDNKSSPLASAETSLAGLRLCFAAVQSAKQGRAINPEMVTGVLK